MKIRNGFVSNSSSCSFTCEICGATEGGTDSIGMEDYGFCYCVNEHELCFECLLGDFEYQEEPKEEDFETEEAFEEADKLYDYYGGSYQPAEKCPICMFQELSERDAVKFLQKEFGTDKAEVLTEIKKKNKRRRVVRNNEYISYVCSKNKINPLKLLDVIKERFTNYKAFRKFLYEK
jgi:hypothetical protein